MRASGGRRRSCCSSSARWRCIRTGPDAGDWQAGVPTTATLHCQMTCLTYDDDDDDSTLTHTRQLSAINGVRLRLTTYTCDWRKSSGDFEGGLQPANWLAYRQLKTWDLTEGDAEKRDMKMWQIQNIESRDCTNTCLISWLCVLPLDRPITYFSFIICVRLTKTFLRQYHTYDFLFRATVTFTESMIFGMISVGDWCKQKQKQTCRQTKSYLINTF